MDKSKVIKVIAGTALAIIPFGLTIAGGCFLIKKGVDIYKKKKKIKEEQKNGEGS